LQDGTAVPI
jgi:hypothetical protein